MKKVKKFVRQLLVRRNQKLLDDKLKILLEVRKESEIEQIMRFREKYGPAMIPCEYIFEMQKAISKIVIFKNEEGVSVDLNGVRIYLPEHHTDSQIISDLTTSLIEQHADSPHRYEHDLSSPLEGQIAVLIGASDCVFASQIARKFKKLYLVEPDTRWHSTMRLTMDQLGVDYEIITCYIGSCDEGNTRSIDSLLSKEQGKIDFIQADIEGAELSMLIGAQNIIKIHRPKFSVCCYHTVQQEREVGDFFAARNYTVKLSKGYIDPLTAKPLQYPFLRKGVIYAS